MATAPGGVGSCDKLGAASPLLLGVWDMWLLLGVEGTVDVKQLGTKGQKNKENNKYKTSNVI